MDSTASPDRRPLASLRPGAWHWALPALGFLLYALFLAHYIGAYAGGSDSSGYLNNARLLAQGRVTVPMRRILDSGPETRPYFTYVPLGFTAANDQVSLIPTYPPGLPLLFAGMAQVAGWKYGPELALGLQALLGLWLVYRLARALGLGPGWAWVGTAMLATSPLFIFMALQPMSDMPALVWVTAAVYFAWICRDRTWLAFGAGVALSVAVLVRPSNLLAAVPVAIALGWSWRRWFLLVAGGLPGAMFLSLFNFAAYGAIYRTGYGVVVTEFSRAVVPATIGHYAVWLPVLLTPAVVLALALPALWRRRPGPVILLGVWALIFPAFYASNVHTHVTWWFLRFILPSYPPLIVASLLVAEALAVRSRLAPRPSAMAMAGAVAVLYGVFWTVHLDAYHVTRSEQVYADTCAWLRARLPANAVVATMQTSGALFYYTDFTFIRWDMLSPAEFQRIARDCAAARRPLYAVLFPFEIQDSPWKAFDEHMKGQWTQVGAVRRITIWRYDSPPAL